jgi:HK97 family phage portal protein
MGLLSWLRGEVNHVGEESNGNVPDTGSVGPNGYAPGDPNGVVLEEATAETRSLPSFFASPWDGWPAAWSTPEWGAGGVSTLVDTAWACLDLNASVLASMPVYKTRNGQVVEAEAWMVNPDPRVYSSWQEFAKSLFWDYQMGEAFVLATDYYSTGFPMYMRVLPPWSVTVDIAGGIRRYKVGTVDITADVLHIRYASSIDQAHGRGPLEVAGARLTAAGVLARYAAEITANGGLPPYTLETDQPLNADAAQEILTAWVAARRSNFGKPAVLDSGVQLKSHQAMSPRDMAMLEIAQFTEARIAVLLGVPPFLVGLPSGGDSMTYSNVSSLFDFHDRASLRPKSSAVMSAISNWALPRGAAIEVNRDEYTRPDMLQRAQAYQILHGIGALSAEQIASIERLTGDAVTSTFLPGGVMQ